jgi:hypothetical protein
MTVLAVGSVIWFVDRFAYGGLVVELGRGCRGLPGRPVVTVVRDINRAIIGCWTGGCLTAWCGVMVDDRAAPCWPDARDAMAQIGSERLGREMSVGICGTSPPRTSVSYSPGCGACMRSARRDAAVRPARCRLVDEHDVSSRSRPRRVPPPGWRSPCRRSAWRPHAAVHPAPRSPARRQPGRAAARQRGTRGEHEHAMAPPATRAAGTAAPATASGNRRGTARDPACEPGSLMLPGWVATGGT